MRSQTDFRFGDRAVYDRLRRAAGIPSTVRPTIRPFGARDEAWLLAKPGRLEEAIRFASSAPMLACGRDGWAPSGSQIEFRMTRDAIVRYLETLSVAGPR